MDDVPRWLVAAPLLLACGSRTGLEAPSPGAIADAAPPSDAIAQGDSPLDAGGCDGGPLEIAIALGDDGTLYRFDAATGKSQPIGVPECGNDNVQWTMTASRDTAYIVYTDWTIYAVSLTTMACSPTPFQPGQLGLDGEFGVAVTGSGASELLYVYGLRTGSSSPVLAVADTSSFVLHEVGPVLPAPPASSFPVNLTADATGLLYAFSPGGWLQKIDPATAKVLEAVDSGVTTPSTWATIAYVQDLFLWVGPRVDGYDLATRTRTSDRDVGVRAVGASGLLVCPGG